MKGFTMKVKSIGTNQTEVEINGWLVLVSYETPVAAMRIEDRWVLKCEEKFSKTTTKHIDSWIDKLIDEKLISHISSIKQVNIEEKLLTGKD
jgi:hypothetical protein